MLSWDQMYECIQWLSSSQCYVSLCDKLQQTRNSTLITCLVDCDVKRGIRVSCEVYLTPTTWVDMQPCLVDIDHDTMHLACCRSGRPFFVVV